MGFFRQSYRTLRSVLFTAIIVAVSLYLLVYIALSLPFVQNQIREIAQSEMSKFLGTKVSIDRIQITPFSQVLLDGVDIPTPGGDKCIHASRIAAGISLFELIRHRRIVITFAEILDFDGHISQPAKDAPLNIQFIIDAFKPKHPGQPPTQFDLRIRNVVIRRMALTYDKLWKPRNPDPKAIDFNHLAVSNLSLDVTIPRLSNDQYIVDLRRLSLQEKSGFTLDKLSLKADITPNELTLTDIEISLPGTHISPSNISLQYSGFDKIGDAMLNGRHRLSLSNNRITLSDFSAFLPALSYFTEPLLLSLDVVGSKSDFKINEFKISTPNDRLHLDIAGSVILPSKRQQFETNLPTLNFFVSADEMAKVIQYILPAVSAKNSAATLSDKNIAAIKALGAISLKADAKYIANRLVFDGDLVSSLGGFNIDVESRFPSKGIIDIAGSVKTDGFNIAPILPESGLGRVVFDISTDIALRGKVPDGTVKAVVDLVEYKSQTITNINLDAEKHGDHIVSNFSIDDQLALVDAATDITLSPTYKSVKGNIAIDRLLLSDIEPKLSRINSVSGCVSADIALNGPDDLIGNIDVSDLLLTMPDGEDFTLNRLSLTATHNPDDDMRDISLMSDYADMDISGRFHFSRMPAIFQSMLAKALPSLIAPPSHLPAMQGEYFTAHINIHQDDTLTDYFRLPFRLLTNVPISASLDGDRGVADLKVEIPYLQQGKNKLISNTALSVQLDDNLSSAIAYFTTQMPVKNSQAVITANLSAADDALATDLSWVINRDHAYDGKISLTGKLSKNPETRNIDILANINKSLIHVNDATWIVDPATISYSDKLVKIDGVRVSHGQQFVNITGTASALPTDTVTVALSGMDLDYVFETLNINYVTFGGMATGTVKACGAFSSEPRAFTDGLWVQGLSYNGAVLGDAELFSSWDNAQQKVNIGADIETGQSKNTTIDGGIWVTRDSLSFDLDAHKVNIEFLQPFMAAFSSEVKGQASGQAKLYGTFSDIDLVGRLKADTIRLKLDYTNTYYAGSDSVFLNPGHIIIPPFRLYDKYGHSALFSGWLKHRYFHEPRFEFKMRDAQQLLCYDTDAKFNPDWYGTIYGNGSATVTGDPAMTSILVDMTTTRGSDFTFVLNDNEAVDDYRFLSFTDRRKEQRLKDMPDTVPDFVKLFNKSVEQQTQASSGFNLDIRATITTQTQVNLVMDPVANDRIKAFGDGAMQISYSSENDDFAIYGKYVVQEGNYNFSLQDLILKDFTIRPGSSVTFNGDPLRAILDITAAYRVNTSLTELDPSFASDRDLNRTYVPVEALLLVSGEIDSPEIKFDIDLPTVNADVQRKVRSLISTDDMMSRQVIYLLALNRFYAPDYTNATSSGGGEFASVASSTLSSQLSNIIGALSDKWTIAPSFRTDKGDFSDMEFDVSIATGFLNNRLLINGNFGYRDRSTSNTTFVGDFDIEYLLNRSGNLRLKAYNHFNDQNYYLRSSLTTQGVGIVLRRDFDDAFSWFKRLRRKFTSKSKSESQSPSE